MFEKRNISKEEAIKRACKDNDLEYCPKNKLIINPSLNDIKYSIGDKFILTNIKIDVINQNKNESINYNKIESEIINIGLIDNEAIYMISFDGHTIFVKEDYLNKLKYQ